MKKIKPTGIEFSKLLLKKELDRKNNNKNKTKKTWLQKCLEKTLGINDTKDDEKENLNYESQNKHQDKIIPTKSIKSETQRKTKKEKVINIVGKIKNSRFENAANILKRNSKKIELSIMVVDEKTAELAMLEFYEKLEDKSKEENFLFTL